MLPKRVNLSEEMRLIRHVTMCRMTPAERRAATIKLLAQLDQDEQEAATIAANPTNTLAERKRANRYRDFFRRSIANAERVLAKLQAEALPPPNPPWPSWPASPKPSP